MASHLLMLLHDFQVFQTAQCALHVGEISLYEVVALQDADAAALAGRPWPPVPDAAAATAASLADQEQHLQLPAAAGAATDQEQLLETRRVTGGGNGMQQPPAAAGADGHGSGVQQPGQLLDDAAPLLGPQLPPGGSFLSADAAVPDAAPALVPQVAEDFNMVRECWPVCTVV